MIRIKNWDKFQHFKDRRPPWIKLHREILEQRDIAMLSDCSFRVLVGLWLLASEDIEKQGILPDIDDMSFRLRIDKTKLINSLKELESYLIQDDIKEISEQHQSVPPETETETYKQEGEKEDKTSPKQKTRFDDWWAVWPKKVGKDAALKKWKSGKGEFDSMADQLIIDVENRKANCWNWLKDNGQFIPNPATYLNGKRWEDDLIPIPDCKKQSKQSFNKSDYEETEMPEWT